MIFQIEEPVPHIRASLSHYVEMYPQFLEPASRIFALGTVGSVQQFMVESPAGNVYGVSTFSDLGNIVAPISIVTIESSWLPYCNLYENLPQFQAVQVSSTIGVAECISGLPEFHGFVKGEHKQKLVVRAPKSGVFGVVETAAPSWGVFSEVTPSFYADLWREGEGQYCNVEERLPRMSGLMLVENKARFKVNGALERFTGESHTYEVCSSWEGTVAFGPKVIIATNQVIESGALFEEPTPSFVVTISSQPLMEWAVDVSLNVGISFVFERIGSVMEWAVFDNAGFVVDCSLINGNCLSDWNVISEIQATTTSIIVSGGGKTQVELIDVEGGEVRGKILNGSIAAPLHLNGLGSTIFGQQVSGSTASMVLLSDNSYVRVAQVSGSTLTLSVTAPAECRGSIVDAYSYLGDLGVVAPYPTIQVSASTGVLGQAVFYDSNSTVEGVGREYIGFR